MLPTTRCKFKVDAVHFHASNDVVHTEDITLRAVIDDSPENKLSISTHRIIAGLLRHQGNHGTRVERVTSSERTCLIDAKQVAIDAVKDVSVSVHPAYNAKTVGKRRKRTTISMQAAQLVWMITNRRLVPDGHFIDHIDTNRRNDHPDNLQLMEEGESHKQGFDMMLDIQLSQACRWFEFVGQHGREPITEHEVLYVETGF